MPAQVDGAGLHVDVHQVVHDAALDVILHTVHQEAPAHIDHLNQRQVPAGGAGPSDAAQPRQADSASTTPQRQLRGGGGTDRALLLRESGGSESAIPTAEWG